MTTTFLLAFLASAHAKVPVSMTFGALGVMDTAGEGWVGEYLYFGPSLTIKAGDHFSLIPQLAVEASPELGNWGFVATTTLEWEVGEHVGLGLVPSVVQDITSDGTAWILAVGPGATYIFSSGVTASVAVQANYTLNEDIPLTVNPILQFSVPFP